MLPRTSPGKFLSSRRLEPTNRHGLAGRAVSLTPALWHHRRVKRSLQRPCRVRCRGDEGESIPVPQSAYYRPIYFPSAAMRAVTMLSGSRTGSPRLVFSTVFLAALHSPLTLPQTVYSPSSHFESSKQMKNWLSPESGLWDRAIETVPRTCFSLENSALSFWPEPPVPG